MTEAAPSRPLWFRRTALSAGPLVAIVVYASMPTSYLGPTSQVVELSAAAAAAAAVAAWMAIWWLTEATHVTVTALLPLVLLPMTGAMKIDVVAASYGNHLIFLFMGGFIISLAMERWGLHKRIALLTLRMVGSKPQAVVGGFMLSSAFMSMWVSNTATAVMMLPIALSVIRMSLPDGEEALDRAELPEHGRNFALNLMLGIAYGCSIGGIGTIIGTPPNVFVVSYIKDHMGVEISFTQWLAVGMPVVVVLLPITWLLLTRVLYPIKIERLEGGGELTRNALAALGPMKGGETVVLVVFVMTALLWIFRPLVAPISVLGVKPLAGLSDSVIAMLGATALFVLPAGLKERRPVMTWEAAARLPWGILMLFGGGLALAAALESTGVGAYLGSLVGGLRGVPGPVLVVATIALIVFLTELTSNTATTAAFVPVLAAIAGPLGVHPFVLVIPAALAASCAFMMPVATPPNAIVFGSGYVTIPQMARAGLWLNLVAIAVLTALAYAVILPLLGAT